MNRIEKTFIGKNQGDVIARFEAWYEPFRLECVSVPHTSIHTPRFRGYDNEHREIWEMMVEIYK